MAYESVQADLPRFAAPPQYLTAAQVADITYNINNGTNFRITDGEFQLLNTDQNEFTPVNTVGADGAQTIELHDAEA